MTAPLHRRSGPGHCHTCGEPSWIDECKVCFTLRTRPWQPMCGDQVVTPDGWTGRVVAQHGPYSWVSMEATNSPQTWGTSALKPVENPGAK
jgi:hypothetical protein